MRTLVELLVVGALIALTWQQSLQQRIATLVKPKPQPVSKPLVASTPSPPPVRYVTQPAPTPSGQWMWDPSRRSALDRPAYQSNEKSQRYLDAEGRTFWLDGNGVRHYDP